MLLDFLLWVRRMSQLVIEIVIFILVKDNMSTSALKFECIFCSKLLLSLDEMESHIGSVHTGEAPYFCEEQQIEKYNNNDDEYISEKCRMEFRTESERSLHKQLFHKKHNSSFVCSAGCVCQGRTMNGRLLLKPRRRLPEIMSREIPITVRKWKPSRKY